VSEPRSSGSPVPTVPSFSNSTTSNSSNIRTSISRIPKFDPKKQEWTARKDSVNSPLGERSLSDNNVPISHRASRAPTQFRDEISTSLRGRPSRRASTSTVASSPYNTVQHKSLSHSPEKGSHGTPEWKRRLIHGEVAYGEQRDLFAPAGLENIFRPPSPQQALGKTFASQNCESGATMQSSPPVYKHPQETQVEGSGHMKKEPRRVKYEMVDDGSDEFSANDLSYSSSFPPSLRESQQSKSQVGKSCTRSPPTMHQALVKDGGTRMVSGQSDVRNEGLSPIYISRHNTVDGNMDYAAIDALACELKGSIDNHQEETQQEFSADYSVEDEPSQVLPANITVETEDYAHNGHFVNLRRGGHSDEGSFQKRMLSSTSLPAIDESDMLPEESMQASTPKQLPNVRKTRASAELVVTEVAHTPPPVPRTPHPSPSKSGKGEQKTSSGSPLKLFGTYDTFTNQTLLRRLSQFEEHFDGDSKQRSDDVVQSSANHNISEQLPRASYNSENSQRSPGSIAALRRVSGFGVGDLDDFSFSEEVPYDSSNLDSRDEDKENLQLPTLNPKTQSSFKFTLKDSPLLEEGVSAKRRTKITSNRSMTTKRIVSIRRTISGTPDPDVCFNSSSDIRSPSPEKDNVTTPRKRNGDAEWKRLAKSPLKHPTSKRRRTLCGEETSQYAVSKEEIEVYPVQETGHQMQSILSRKRKDASHDNDQQAANPKVLAMRNILRPRTPTPSQRSSIQRERAPLQELDLSPREQARLLQQQKIAIVQAELDSNEPPKNTITAQGVGKHMFDESRKGSITTQDFLDEAKMIMAGIRGKTRPNSGLSSLEESELENEQHMSSGMGELQSEDYEDSYQESTREPFSRPPSREGAPVARQHVKQQDPALLDHLKKYAEISDMDDIVASSIRSIAMARNAARDAIEVNRITEETISRATSGRMIESDPPNIRITESAEIQRKRKHSASTVEKNSDDNQDFLSQGSTASSQSTQSVPTGSSRGSDSRRVIAPHTVSHLIPEELAGMVFDRNRNIWIKNKTVSSQGRPQNLTPSDDDDPFGDIPDLSVDETQEMQRIKAVAEKRKEEARIAQSFPDSDNDLNQSRLKSASLNTPTPESAHETFSSASVEPQNDSSKHPKMASHNEFPDLQVTENHRTTKIETSAHQGCKLAKLATTEIFDDIAVEVEKEISILEDRVTSTTPKRRRNVTITFSSPIASVRQMSPPMSPYRSQGDAQDQTDEIALGDCESDEYSGDDSVLITKSRSNHNSTPSKTPTRYRTTSRRFSLNGHKFSARPFSRIDEHDEDCSNEDLGIAEQRTFSVTVASSGNIRKSSAIVVATPRLSREVGTLELTPMSDFTMNQRDSSFGMDVSYVEGGQRFTLGSNSSQTLSLSIKHLVEKLTEVEPYEPFWESMKEIDLKDKRLSSLHKLDEFCHQLEDLDVSGNQLSQLSGAPRNLRHLSIARNYLSDLTAWGHLSNLQYVDVSNNELESLSAFSSLVHLRSLRADNNKIKSLDGIGGLDGLLSLRLRGNLLQSLDFSGTRLQRLSDIDLNGNLISSVQNIHQLRSLTTLSLEYNKLTAFDIEISEKHENLKHLRLNGNLLESIDVSQMPNLRLLYLDHNQLGTITGLLKTKYLDSLSMREQRDGSSLNTAFLSEAFEVRKLFLSANLIKPFTPRANFLNLQYLELANCGLEELPAEFGEMFPNVRVLNLSMNALKEIDGLVGIVRLKTLYMAGNRLSAVGKTIQILKGFPTLTTVDLRSNPINIGFYPPRLERHVTDLESVHSAKQPYRIEPFTLANCDKAWDRKYLSRLDMKTKKLRRIYEMVLIGGSKRLRNLDGLEVDRAILKVQDDVWEALVKDGILKGKLPLSPPVANECHVQVKLFPPTPEETPVGAPKVAPEPRSPTRTGEVPPLRPWRNTCL